MKKLKERHRNMKTRKEAQKETSVHMCHQCGKVFAGPAALEMHTNAKHRSKREKRALRIAPGKKAKKHKVKLSKAERKRAKELKEKQKTFTDMMSWERGGAVQNVFGPVHIRYSLKELKHLFPDSEIRLFPDNAVVSSNLNEKKSVSKVKMNPIVARLIQSAGDSGDSAEMADMEEDVEEMENVVEQKGVDTEMGRDYVQQKETDYTLTQMKQKQTIKEMEMEFNPDQEADSGTGKVKEEPIVEYESEKDSNYESEEESSAESSSIGDGEESSDEELEESEKEESSDEESASESTSVKELPEPLRSASLYVVVVTSVQAAKVAVQMLTPTKSLKNFGKDSIGEQIWYKYVKQKEILRSLSNRPIDLIALDMEGEELGMSGGTISLLQLVSSYTPVFLFDNVLLEKEDPQWYRPAELGSDGGRSGFAQRILQNPAITKLLFDGRMDVCALEKVWNVKLKAAYDLQVLYAYRFCGDCEQFLKGLGRVVSVLGEIYPHEPVIAAVRDLKDRPKTGLSLRDQQDFRKGREDNNVDFRSMKLSEENRNTHRICHSEWSARPLTRERMAYAVGDVAVLMLMFARWGWPMQREQESFPEQKMSNGMKIDTFHKTIMEICKARCENWISSGLEKCCGKERLWKESEREKELELLNASSLNASSSSSSLHASPSWSSNSRVSPSLSQADHIRKQLNYAGPLRDANGHPEAAKVDFTLPSGRKLINPVTMAFKKNFPKGFDFDSFKGSSSSSSGGRSSSSSSSFSATRASPFLSNRGRNSFYDEDSDASNDSDDLSDSRGYGWGYGGGGGYCGFSADDCEELMCQGVKPWEDDAENVLAFLHGGF